MEYKRQQRKSVLLSVDLFCDICKYFFRVGEESPLVLEERINEGLRYKLEDMKRHDDYIPPPNSETYRNPIDIVNDDFE